MGVKEHRLLFVVVVLVLALVAASPVLSRVLVFPRTAFFTELWLLGPGGMAEDYPYNVSSGQEYQVVLGIRNRLGSCSYYVVMVHFRNKTMPRADSFNRTPSGLRPLLNLTVFLEDEGMWVEFLSFRFDYSVNWTARRVSFERFTLNNVSVSLSGYTAGWDSEQDEFMGELVFELWLYDREAGRFQYHERFVNLRLNMTGS